MILQRQIVWEDAAAREFDRLPTPIQHQIDEGLARLVLAGQGDLRHLSGVRGDEWRLRVGDYRIRFAMHDGDMVILHVRHRSHAY